MNSCILNHASKNARHDEASKVFKQQLLNTVSNQTDLLSHCFFGPFGLAKRHARCLACNNCRLDVVIDVEYVIRIIFGLDIHQPFVVSTISSLETTLGLRISADEINVATIAVERVHCLPVVLGPILDFLSPLWFRSDAGNNHRPSNISSAPSS